MVNALSQQGHVPYRDSKLTRILKCSLGGNSKTLLVVHISPAEDSASESVSTLLFAQRAKKVVNNAKINEYIDNLSENLLEELQKAR